jgi:hypothetical protein
VPRQLRRPHDEGAMGELIVSQSAEVAVLGDKLLAQDGPAVSYNTDLQVRARVCSTPAPPARHKVATLTTPAQRRYPFTRR